MTTTQTNKKVIELVKDLLQQEKVNPDIIKIIVSTIERDHTYIKHLEKSQVIPNN